MLTHLSYFLTTLSLVSLCACSFLNELPSAVGDAPPKTETSCSRDLGYSTGVNDGKNGRDMQVNFTPQQPCTPEQLLQVREGYQEGYKLGLTNQPSKTPAAVEVKFDSTHPKWQCLESYSKNTKACGFNCQRGFKNVFCTNHPNVFCPGLPQRFTTIDWDKFDAISADGIKCGENCTYDTKTKAEFCERYPYYRSVKPLN